MYRILLLSAFVAGTAAAAADQTECRYGDMQRSIEVVYSVPGQAVPCEVLYTKAGESISTPWRANHEAGYCEARASDLADRLRNFGWDCDAAVDASNPTNAGDDTSG